MASRALLQLLTLSIIFTKQIDALCLDRAKNVDNPESIVNKTTENICSDKANENIRNNRVLTKKTYSNNDQQSDTNLGSKYKILTGNKHNIKSNHIYNEELNSEISHGLQESDENIKANTPSIVTPTRREITSLNKKKHFPKVDKRIELARYVNSNNKILVDMAQNTAIDKNKQESETELDPNNGSSSQNDAEKYTPTVQRLKHILTFRRHKKNTRATQAMVYRWNTEGNDKKNDILCEAKHGDYKNYRLSEKISRENAIYRLKCPDETKQESKHAKKFRKFKRLPISDKVSKSKHSDQIDTISKENEIYEYKLVLLSDTESLEPVKQKMKNPRYKPKFSHDFQKKKHRENIPDKVSKSKKKYISKKNEIHKLELFSNTESVEPVKQQVKNPKYKPKFSHDFQTKKHRENTVKQVFGKVKHTLTSKTKHDFEKVIPNKDKNKLTMNGNRDIHTDLRYGECSDNSTDTHEQETLDSSEDQLNENDPNKPRLPFYISSTTPKYPKKHTNKQEMLLDHLNTVLKGSSDINETIDRLASSKIVDFITARVADQMLKKLQTSQAFNNLSNFTTTHEKAEKVEHIDILFKDDGDTVVINREKVKENPDIPDFTLFPGQRGKNLSVSEINYI